MEKRGPIGLFVIAYLIFSYFLALNTAVAGQSPTVSCGGLRPGSTDSVGVIEVNNDDGCALTFAKPQPTNVSCVSSGSFGSGTINSGPVYNDPESAIVSWNFHSSSDSLPAFWEIYYHCLKP